MNLIDRYVHAVAEYLPSDIREDVKKELRTNIEDMMPEDYVEKDVYKNLEEMGSPLNLANEYLPKKRYLIGPGYFDKYLQILKIVVGICVIISVSIAITVWIVNFSEVNFNRVVELFVNVITGALVGTIQVVFWITLVFVVLERNGVEEEHNNLSHNKWNPDLLPQVPINSPLKISRGETVFSMISTIILIALLYFQPQLIALYRIGGNGIINSTSLLDINRLKAYMIFILALGIINLCIFVWKYMVEIWNMSLIVSNAIYNLLMCILVVIMINDKSLFKVDFVLAIAEFTKISIETVVVWFDRCKWIFAVSFICFCAWDSISKFYKLIKQNYSNS